MLEFLIPILLTSDDILICYKELMITRYWNLSSERNFTSCWPVYDCHSIIGWFQCEQSCTNNTYGPHCQLKCDCGDFPCDPRTGQCECPMGLHGTQCRQGSSLFFASLTWLISESCSILYGIVVGKPVSWSEWLLKKWSSPCYSHEADIKMIQ